ncbi:TIGR03086 family metal-binding protein [Actinomadura viridis]|uniref:Uncharacterized protein (TIGR03086 family) n=1 Tax=Actinomadura viridis TaxID=58110 RepID=A0A931DNF1_9ACTN|nr:TIGR03086 family metal-binding protein [Actinomadura viridis]MBG6090330.1 uncharacterized protein (TIGR03086 family) [Actinomadura viridis]
MNARDAAALHSYGAGLLERAVGFALDALDALPPFALDDLLRPTPCEGWDLWMLLRHFDDSLAVLNEAVGTGSVRLEPPAKETALAWDPAGELVASLRRGAGRLLGAWTAAGRGGGVVTVAGCPMRAGVVAGTGAVELVVHAWDAARACGEDLPIPVPLAERLLRLAPLLVPDHARPGLFGPPAEAPAGAPPGDRLVAFLGRDPQAGR